MLLSPSLNDMSNIETVMRALEAQDASEREAGLPSAQRMRALVPEAGRFIHIVIRAMRARRILEIGTSYGYSTLWLASAAQAHGGRVETLELDAARVAAAREYFARAGLSDVITQHQGDARQIIPTLGDDFDFIFVDAEKDDYEDYLALTLDKVVRDGLIMADNVLSHADQLQHYSEKAQHTPGLLSVTVPVGRGEEMSLRVGDTALPPEVVAALAEAEIYAKSHPGTTIARTLGKFLYMLARAAHARSALLLSASTTVAGLWLGAAMQATGGRLFAVEQDRSEAKRAGETFAKARLASRISIAPGKALDVLPTLDQAFDFVCLDAGQADHEACIDALWPKLSPNGLILANRRKDTANRYIQHMQSRADALSVTLPFASSLELTLKSEI